MARITSPTTIKVTVLSPSKTMYQSDSLPQPCWANYIALGWEPAHPQTMPLLTSSTFINFYCKGKLEMFWSDHVTDYAGSTVETESYCRPVKSRGISRSLQKWRMVSRSPGIVPKSPGIEVIWLIYYFSARNPNVCRILQNECLYPWISSLNVG